MIHNYLYLIYPYTLVIVYHVIVSYTIPVGFTVKQTICLCIGYITTHIKAATFSHNSYYNVAMRQIYVLESIYSTT